MGRLRPNARHAASFAMPRDASIGFESAELKLIQVSHFARPAVIAFEQHSRHSFRGIRDGGKFHSPQIGPGIEYLDAIEVAFFFTSELSHHPDVALPLRFAWR